MKLRCGISYQEKSLILREVGAKRRGTSLSSAAARVPNCGIRKVRRRTGDERASSPSCTPEEYRNILAKSPERDVGKSGQTNGDARMGPEIKSAYQDRTLRFISPGLGHRNRLAFLLESRAAHDMVKFLKPRKLP